MAKPLFFVRTQDIMKIENCSQSQAYRSLDKVRKSLPNKANSKAVRLSEYCDYYEVNIADVTFFLQQKA